MKSYKQSVTAVLCAVLTLGISAAVIAHVKPDRFYLPQTDQPFEGKVDTRIGTLEFDNQYPSKESMKTILDSMDFHGVHDKFKFGQTEFFVFGTLEEKLGVLTANATTPYIGATPDLTKTGPLVVDMPAGMLAGMIDDFWQRPITDIGLVGPDKGKGAKYLIIPPGYKGKRPKGYLVFESATNNIFLAIRIIEPDPKKAAALQAAFRIYPYKDRATAKKGVYTSPPSKYFFGPPRGMAFWERLHEILNREVVAERDRFFMAMLKRLGIEKGKPFNPTARQKKLLEEAAFVGEAMAKANDLAIRTSARKIMISSMSVQNGCTKL
jgi:hypothetical protein